MSASADVTMAVHQASAMNALKQFEARFRAMMANLQRDVRKQTKATKEVGQGFGHWAIGLGKAIGAAGLLYGVMTGIRTVSQAIRQDIEGVVQAQKDAKTATMPFHAIMRQIGRSLPTDTDMTEQQLTQMLLDANIPDRRQGALILRDILSARSEEKVSEVANVAKEMMEISREEVAYDPGSIGAYSRAVLYAMRQFGGTTRQQAGLLYAGAAQSATIDPELFAKNIGMWVSDSAKFGYSEKYAMSLGAAYSSVMGDTEGTTTRTNLNIRAAQMQEIARRRLGANAPRGEALDAWFISDDPIAVEERKKYLGAHYEGLSDDELKQLAEIEGGGSVRGRMKGRIATMGLAQPEGQMEGPGTIKFALRRALESLPTLAEAGDRMDQIMQRRIGSEGQRELEISLDAQASQNRADLIASQAIAGQFAEQAPKLAGQTGGGVFEENVRTFLRTMFNKSPTTDETLAQYRRLINQRQAVLIEKAGLSGRLAYDDVQLTPESRETTAGISSWDKRARLRAMFGGGADRIIGDELQKLNSTQQQLLRVLQTLENELILKSQAPQEVIDKTPKLRAAEPAGAAGVANQ